ncbi:pantoate--beta-alanine ligase [Mesorhizobium sp. YC-39]|uniref:pantoate--beta-alanine ligase n=1 Tax=Mesorhizobium sp. YC-39 TaxID=2986065 RepID=UPI003993D94F
MFTPPPRRLERSRERGNRSNCYRASRYVAGWGRPGASVAMVPTMGALHEGHLSLVRAALEKADRVIVTLFVNPKQFNNAADIATYPRTEDEDAAKLVPLGAHLLYVPDAGAMYPGSLRHDRFGVRCRRRPVRHLPAGPFRWRGDRRRQALPADRR